MKLASERRHLLNFEEKVGIAVAGLIISMNRTFESVALLSSLASLFHKEDLSHFELASAAPTHKEFVLYAFRFCCQFLGLGALCIPTIFARWSQFCAQPRLQRYVFLSSTATDPIEPHDYWSTQLTEYTTLVRALLTANGKTVDPDSSCVIDVQNTHGTNLGYTLLLHKKLMSSSQVQ